MIRVKAFNAALPNEVRREVELFGRQSVADMVNAVLPNAANHVLDAVRVVIHINGGQSDVDRRVWHRTFPLDGALVTVQVPPELGAILGLAGTISTAITSSLYYAGITGLGVIGTNAVYLGTVAALGGLAVAAANALIPTLPNFDGQATEEGYALSGWQNNATPNRPVPLVLGRQRVAPMFAAQPYTEIVGDDQYVRALFCFGYGRLNISDIRIGDVPIDDMTGVQYQVREGAPTDASITLVRTQVLEQSVRVELAQPQDPTDDAGNEIEGDLVDQPQTYVTASNASRASVVFHFPGGLRRNNDDGGTSHTENTVVISQRPYGAEEWQQVQAVTYSERTTTPFFRQVTWDLPERGKYEVQILRTDTERPGNRRVNSMTLWAFQSMRPEYPINMDKPLALLAVRIKASFQFNGGVDNLTAIAQRYCRDWNGTEWVEGLTSNPASLFAHALTGNHGRFPVQDTEIDWDALVEWHAYCVAQGLNYHFDHRDRIELRTLLTEIAAAGRATPRHDGERWSVVIDREPAFVTRHIGPRNSRDFKGERSYFEPPDGLRVKFSNEDDGYEDREIVMPWIGVAEADVQVAQQHTLKGRTNAGEVQRALYRFMLESQLRRDRWSVVMMDATEVVERGDHVRLSHYALNNGMVNGRVLNVVGNRVTLDEQVQMQAGQSYGLSWHRFDSADTVGNAQTAEVVTEPGDVRSLLLVGQTLPGVGDLVCFGPGEEITEQAVVLYIEPGSNGARVVHMTNAATQLDAMTAAFEPSEFDGIVGEIIGSDTVPLVPLFAGVSTAAAAGAYGLAERELRVAATTDPEDTAGVGSLIVEHRRVGETEWSSAAINGPSGSVGLTYDDGDVVELRVHAVRVDAVTGPVSGVVSFTVGSDLSPAAQEPDLSAMSVSAGLGHAAIQMRHSDGATQSIEVFRAPSGTAVDTSSDSIGVFDISSMQSVTILDGDSSRADLLDGLSFDGPSGGAVSHALSIEDGKTYRGIVQIDGATLGSVNVALTGTASDVVSPDLTGDGAHLFRLTASAGLNAFTLTRSVDFDGTTSVILIEETPASIPAGPQDYWFSALNQDGLSTALSGPITVSIV